MLRNDDGAWTSLLTFAETQVWSLSNGPGIKQVSVKLHSSASGECETHDTILSTTGQDIVLNDGFEQGDTGAWSLAVVETGEAGDRGGR